MTTLPVSPTDVERAQTAIAGAIVKTPLVSAPSLSEAAGCEVSLKLEVLKGMQMFRYMSYKELVRISNIAEMIELSTDHGDDGVVLASGDAFVADTTARGLLATRAEITDMEGYALAAVAADAGVPLTMLKHVSDEADEHAARSWLESVAASARELAAWAAANVPGY